MREFKQASRPARHVIRRFTAGFIAAGTMCAGMVGVGASINAASATIPVVVGKVICDTQTGKQNIEWTIKGDVNAAKETATIKTATITTDPTLVGKTVKGAGTVTGVQKDVKSGSTHSQTVEVQWTNHRQGDLVSASATVKVTGDCKPDTPSNPPGQDIECTYIYRDFGRALQNGDHINVTLERKNGSQFQVNVYVDRNISGGYNTLGFRYSDGTTRALKVEEVKKGRIWLDPSSKTSESYFVIRFVQINESENWPNKTCGTPPPPATPKDAAASVTVTPATCEASGTASVKDKKFATLVGTLDQSVGTHTATFKADSNHHFSNNTDTIQVPYTVPGKDTSLCAPKTPKAEASAKVCVKDGEKTGLANITVINTDDDTDNAVDYNVVLNGAAKQITLGDGKSGSVSFDGLAVGDYTVSVKGNDGTSTSTTVKVTKCDTPPIITPPTTPPGVTPPPAPPVKVKGSVPRYYKCGSNRFVKPSKVEGGHYRYKGTTLKEGKWNRVDGRTARIWFVADNANYKVEGKTLFVKKFPKSKSCKTPPSKTPHAGL